MRVLAGLLLFCSLGLSQITFTATKNTVLAAAAEVITVQLPLVNTTTVRFNSLYFDCTVACNITLERSGAVATTTALTINPINLGESVATSAAFSASNVGVGTVLARYSCPSACNTIVDLTGIMFKTGQNNTANLTARTGSMSGTVNITFKFQETQ